MPARCPAMFRQQWYKRDMRFALQRAAIDVDELQRIYADKFEFVSQYYGGNLGFLLVFNSFVFRIPLGLKPYYSPAVLRIEATLAARLRKAPGAHGDLPVAQNDAGRASRVIQAAALAVDRRRHEWAARRASPVAPSW